MTVSAATRQLVRQRAGYLCEYCHSSEEASTALFTLDYLVPQSFGGADDPDNLALACHRCNGRRYNFTTGIDSEPQAVVTLFNPRQQQWSDHFIWTVDGLRILGSSSVGHTTCIRLDLNDDHHDAGSIRNARRLWLRGGGHPSDHDPRQSM